ncbi:MAG: hypothetical protein ACQXXF_08440 [Thermoplasmatota archaeon]
MILRLISGCSRKYIKERELIPTGNLVEIKYEDFIKESLKEVKKNL